MASGENVACNARPHLSRVFFSMAKWRHNHLHQPEALTRSAAKAYVVMREKVCMRVAINRGGAASLARIVES